MNNSISKAWPAPAKLNLFLHINGRRADGYHELQTLFQFIDYGDQLDFAINETGELTLHSTMSNVVANSDNLILRAAKLLQQQTGTQLGAEIWLDKILPMGGGIGGGSSDAATTLVALNQLWATGLSQQQLADIGLQLGADVPVFINGLAAFAEGVGEKLLSVELDEPWYLVITPDVHVSTGEVFQHPQLPRNTPKLKLADLMHNKWHNDCEQLVSELHPQVAKALAWLIEYAPSRMTGTGACVFGTFDSRQQAETAFAQLPASMSGFIAKGTNKSPLMLRLAQC
ncbi:4-(cytidine 5'-diphospho)-2-C-methyl-D-erythritol kinase [Shewanella sp. Isolate11]|uniref:4-(cytidine 5'-diphospho)-2-C-methyl-D-erythritol kinase n=1 Tax=Shewanella sp. Isolate11 TaxID=2908530 RepID=UPI001EFEA616|nr:4-(cytidine 5'-diphospho)-2-C-methyl-D-erythritol kinase [Shewanella sp. Isolate11]MCG9697402.1 4-(cytidine 5'-diphospho)-2-C-methyl-D-erythritol kinase [Shewanella sp. Isolate11]